MGLWNALFGSRDPSLDERLHDLLKVKVRSTLYFGQSSIPGTTYLSVSPDFIPKVAFQEIKRITSNGAPKNGQDPVPKRKLIVHVNAATAKLFEYEVAGLPVILTGLKGGYPISHREVLFVDDKEIAKSTEVSVKTLGELRTTEKWDYSQFLQIVREGIPPFRVEYLRMQGDLNEKRRELDEDEQTEFKWQFSSGKATYRFTAELAKKFDDRDLQEAQVAYIVDVQPQQNVKEPFRVVKLETRVMVYMKPRDDSETPLMNKEHMRMGCFTCVERDQAGKYTIVSRITRRMEGSLEQEAALPGWQKVAPYDFPASLANTANFFTAIRYPNDSLPKRFLSKEGTFVLKK